MKKQVYQEVAEYIDETLAADQKFWDLLAGAASEHLEQTKAPSPKAVGNEDAHFKQVVLPATNEVITRAMFEAAARLRAR